MRKKQPESPHNNHALSGGIVVDSQIRNSLIDSDALDAPVVVGSAVVQSFQDGAANDRLRSQLSGLNQSADTDGKISRSGAFWMPETSRYPVLQRTVALFDQPLGVFSLVAWIILVVIDGAVWFMVTVGMVKPKPEDAQHTAMNVSIQVLCGLFTYACIYNMPQRSFGLLMLFDDDAQLKRNLQHRFHWVPWKERFWIMVLLVLNCVFQFINQAFRCYYWDYVSSNKFPGTLFVNLFFVLSFAAAAWAGAWQCSAERKIFRAHADFVRDRNFSRVTDSLRRESRTGSHVLGITILPSLGAVELVDTESLNQHGQPNPPDQPGGKHTDEVTDEAETTLTEVEATSPRSSSPISRENTVGAFAGDTSRV